MPSPDKRAAARELLAARARRLRILRHRIAASALATFVLAWGVIAWQGSMGEQAVATTSSSADTPTAVTTAQS
jgi:hypothetical protein